MSFGGISKFLIHVPEECPKLILTLVLAIFPPLAIFCPGKGLNISRLGIEPFSFSYGGKVELKIKSFTIWVDAEFKIEIGVYSLERVISMTL